MARSVADRAYRALSELRENLPHLREALIPGTPRRSAGAGLGARAMAALDALVRAERAERDANAARGIKPAAESPAPLVLSVLDSERYILHGITSLESRCCEWLGLTPLAGAEPAERITRVIGLLARLETHLPWIEEVADDAGRLARRAARAVGDVEPMMRLLGRCPICRARSLRAWPERGVVMCVNPGCPCSPTCGTCGGAGRHVWDYDDAALAELRVTA